MELLKTPKLPHCILLSDQRLCLMHELYIIQRKENIGTYQMFFYFQILTYFYKSFKYTKKKKKNESSVNCPISSCTLISVEFSPHYQTQWSTLQSREVYGFRCEATVESSSIPIDSQVNRRRGPPFRLYVLFMCVIFKINGLSPITSEEKSKLYTSLPKSYVYRNRTQ